MLETILVVLTAIVLCVLVVGIILGLFKVTFFDFPEYVGVLMFRSGMRNHYSYTSGNIFIIGENATKFILEKLAINFKPKSPLQKEIEAEQKEIEILEQQKADMKELERLRERKEELFREVNQNTHETDVDVYRCKECGGAKVTRFHFYDRRLGQHIPVNHCADCGTPINEMEDEK